MSDWPISWYGSNLFFVPSQKNSKFKQRKKERQRQTDTHTHTNTHTHTYIQRERKKWLHTLLTPNKLPNQKRIHLKWLRMLRAIKSHPKYLVFNHIHFLTLSPSSSSSSPSAFSFLTSSFTSLSLSLFPFYLFHLKYFEGKGYSLTWVPIHSVMWRVLSGSLMTSSG